MSVSGVTVTTQGSFTASTTQDSDLTVPGLNSVHTIDRLWIDSTHWSVTETLILAFNISVSVTLPESDGDGGGDDSSGGDSSNLLETHNVETTNTISASISRVGFVILVFHAERGISTPAAAGLKWSLNVNYSDAITLAVQGGATKTITPREPEDSGTGSGGSGSGGSGSGGSGPELPQDFQGQSSYNISAAVTVWTGGSIALSATPEFVTIVDGTAIDTSFSYLDTVRVGADVVLGGSWLSSSGSGNLNSPTSEPTILAPEGTEDALEDATSPPNSVSLGSGPISIPSNGVIAGSPLTDGLRDPNLGADIPINQPVGHGHQHGGSGGFNANAGASSSSSLQFSGKIRNNSQFESLTGSLRDGLRNKYGDGDRVNEILVYSTGETTESPGSVSSWTGSIITGVGMQNDKMVDVIGELNQVFQMNEAKELEADADDAVEKVIGGGSENGTDFEIINIKAKSLSTSPAMSTFRLDTLIEAKFEQGQSGGTVDVKNDTADSGELKSNWKGYAYNLRDVQGTLAIKKNPQEGETGHSLGVSKDHDTWQFLRTENGDTTTTVAGDGDATNSGTAGAQSKETISYNALRKLDEDFTRPWERRKFDTLRVGTYNKTLEKGASVDTANGNESTTETTSGDNRVSVTGHWLFDVWAYLPATGELEYHNWDHMPDLATGEGTYTEVYDPTIRYYDTTNYDPRNSYEHILDGSPDPNPPPSGSEPPVIPPTTYPPNKYAGSTWIGWFGGTAGDGVDQVFNVAYGFGDGATFGLSKVIRSNGLFEDRADYDGNAYFVGEMGSMFMPTPTAIAKQGTVVWKLYNKFDDSGKCASMLTKLVHGRCFVAGTRVTISELPYSVDRQASLWNDTNWLPEPTVTEFQASRHALASNPSIQTSKFKLQTSSVSRLLIPIEEVPLGARVPTKNPRPSEYDDSLPEPDEETWMRFAIIAQDSEGAPVEAEFIRPRWWIEQYGIQPGIAVPINISELGLSGLATITELEECVPIASGDGNVVTGRFKTARVDVVVRLEVLGPDGTLEVLEGTTVHPVWSVDRQDWIPLSELLEGECLQAEDGIAVVQSIELVRSSASVYNIEVHGEHAYQVGKLGLLVHNDCVYRAFDAAGNVIYVGITNNPARRAAEHLRKLGIVIEPYIEKLTRAEARAVEQTLIGLYGLKKNGGFLINKINSIAQSNPIFATAIAQGGAIISKMGF